VRLLTFSLAGDRQLRLGALADDGNVVELRRCGIEADDMQSLIAAGPRMRANIEKAVAATPKGHYPLDTVTPHAPIPRPRKNIFCVGWNYVPHFEEGAATRTNVTEFPTYATFFTKAPTCVNGPYAPVPSHADLTATLDWEAELAIVIGERGVDITVEDAMHHVFGYMVANDVSAREVQRRHGQQWFKGKSLDGHLPIGPWIVTADELSPPLALQVVCRVNGVVKQNSNTRQMHFDIPAIIAELSSGLTLDPGDIILTGTPPGVGHARTPPEFMKPGDILETEITGVGTLRNEIV
jgi:2-keto-4-pentenoate hydratase/2-oxohepta-3-ene-1,7-dioic acid hydratase in catechol pathway